MVSRIFFAIIGILFMLVVYKKVKQKKLSEKESMFWIVGGVGVLVLGIFPNIIQVLARILGIEYPPSLLFMIGILFCLIIIFRLSIYVSTLKEQTKELAQLVAILEKRVNDLGDQS